MTFWRKVHHIGTRGAQKLPICHIFLSKIQWRIVPIYCIMHFSIGLFAKIKKKSFQTDPNWRQSRSMLFSPKNCQKLFFKSAIYGTLTDTSLVHCQQALYDWTNWTQAQQCTAQRGAQIAPVWQTGRTRRFKNCAYLYAPRIFSKRPVHCTVHHCDWSRFQYAMRSVPDDASSQSNYISHSITPRPIRKILRFKWKFFWHRREQCESLKNCL